MKIQINYKTMIPIEKYFKLNYKTNFKNGK